MPTPAPSPLIEAVDVRKRFDGNDVLRGVSLQVEAGRVLSLLGPSGCGKTTLLRCLAGLDELDVGEVRLGGRTVSSPSAHVPPERRRIGMVFQDWALFPHLTVARNVAYGLPRSDLRRDRVRQALAMVGLDQFADRLPGTLSGGQQQRVALARALAPEPSLLLLDEPFSNLDATLRVHVRAEVHHLLASLEITTVFVTHDQEEAFVLGDEVAVMRAGEIVQQGSPHRIYTTPASRWVAEFVGDANLLPGEADGARARTVLGAVPLAVAGAEGSVEVLVRPEHLTLGPGADGGDGADAHDGHVELVEYHGHDTVYLVRLPAGAEVKVRGGSPPPYRRGDRVAVRYGGPPTVCFPAVADDEGLS